MLARVVEAAEGRVVAVIGGDEAEVVRPHRRLDLGEAPVERLEAGGVAGDVAAMAVFGVEIDEIDEDRARRPASVFSASSSRSTLPSLLLPLRSSPVSRWAKMSPILPIETIARPACAARCSRLPSGGGTAKSLRLGVRTKSFAVPPTKGRAMTRPIFKRIAEAARDAAELVEPLEPEGLLMRGDLEHGIGRGVADRLPRPQVLLAELLDDVGARGVPVAEDARKPALGDQRCGQRLRKGGDRLREIAPVEIDRRAGDLPMAGGRVLAARRLDPIAPLAAGSRQREARRRPPGRGHHRVAEAERVETRKAERPAPQAVAIASAERAGLGDMAERVGAFVAVSRGVVRAAAADRIEHDDDGAGHFSALQPAASS